MWRNTKALIIFGFCLGLIIVPNFVSAIYEDWGACRNITIDHNDIDSDLTDFPLMVKLNSSRIDYSKTKDDGSDIRFADAPCYSGGSALEYGIEKWNESGDSFIWVKVPSVSSSTDTIISVYYDNPTASSNENMTAVWDDNTVGVFLFNETTGNVNDYSASPLTNTGQSITGQGILSKVDGGVDATTQSDYIKYSSASKIEFGSGSSFTVCAWFKTTDVPSGYQNYLIYKRISGGTGWYLAVSDSGTGIVTLKQYRSGGNDKVDSSTAGFNNGEWWYVCAGRDGSTLRMFVNGAENATTSSVSTDAITGGNLELIGLSDTSSSIMGYQDTTIISNTWRGADWIKADYESQRDDLLSIGSEQTSSEITISDLKENPSDPATYSSGATYQFNATICDDYGAGDISSVKFEWSGSNTTITDYATINTTCREYYTSKSDLSADTYNYKWYAEDTTNSLYDSETVSYTVNKASSSCSLSFDPSSPIDYGNAFKALCSCSGASDEGGTTKLYRNDTDVTSENNTNVTLGAGTYNYVCNVTSTQNYTSASDSANYVINPIDAGLSLSSTAGWLIYENEETVLECSATTNASVKLKIEDSFVSNPYTLTGEIGEYTVSCLTEDTQNYTSTEINNTLIVNPLISCTDNETFAFEINISTSSDITTLNFTDLVNNHYVRDNLGDVIAINVSDEWINTTDGYYFVVNNTGLSEFTVRFGNYFVNNSYSTHSTSNIKNVTDYTQINPYVIYKIRNEITGELMFPPNATLSSIIVGSRGETYIPIENNDTKFLIATNEYVDKVSLRVLYTADMYYSRQIYPSEADQTIFDAYVVDAQEHALDRIDFLMEDMNYYNSKLQIYKNLGNSTIIITEGYFDISHYFSAYLMEDTDYYLRTIDSTNGITEFGRLTVVAPAEKVLSKATINLNPQAVLIGDYLLMNAYTDDNRTTLYIQYNDDLNETDNVTIAVLFGNGTVWQNHTYYANSVNTEYNITDYNDTDFTVTFTVYHQTFGNSPVTYTMGIFAPVFWDLGFSSGLYNLISLAVLVIIGGITTRRSLIAGILIFSIVFILFVALGWLTAGGWLLFTLIMIVGVLSIINYLQGGAE